MPSFAIKAEVNNPRALTFAFSAQKTMYGGKHIAKGDTIFVFASENEGGPGLIASGVVTSAKSTAKKRGVARQTPRVSVTIRRTALGKRRLGRSGLKLFSDWNDGHPRPSSISNSIVRQRTRSSAFRMKRRHSSADSSSAAYRSYFGFRPAWDHLELPFCPRRTTRSITSEAAVEFLTASSPSLPGEFLWLHFSLSDVASEPRLRRYLTLCINS